MRHNVSRITRMFACAIALTCALTSCSAPPRSSSSEAPLSASDIEQSAPSENASDVESSTSADSAQALEQPVDFPIGWLAIEANDIPAGTALHVLSLPDMDIIGHRNGIPIESAEQAERRAAWPIASDSDAIVEYDGRIAAVPADFLLVNLPDMLPQTEYDIVYSYSSTSRCAGQGIPGVTGERLPGYADGIQDNQYLAKPQFAVPCAYRTTLKTRDVCATLAESGYLLLVYDAYRPMSAQWRLSDAFENAFWSNPEMQASLGDWTLNWYVANGASGHNYGTDLDVGACGPDGTPLPMPSEFDAFDESGHLTDSPMNAGDITPEAYRQAVIDNAACMALHDAFSQAGFTELASEWWHFGDNETEASMRALVGGDGLDFVA